MALPALRRAFVATAAMGILAGLSGAIAGPAYAVNLQRPAGQPAASAFSLAGGLDGVAATSDSNAWAVGYAGESLAGKILMLHWNGTAWSRVTTPSVLTATGELRAVTALSAKNAWAVGYTGKAGTGKDHSLLLHWNGSAWSQVTAPVTGGNLNGVAATAKSGWAVGYVSRNPDAPLCCAGSPLVFRKHGSKWSRITTKLGKGSYLDGVAITAADRAWAVGGPLAMITGALAKWNGSAWSWATDPIKTAYSPLDGIAAGPGGTAFIVGADNDTLAPAVSARWNGKAWQRVTVRAPDSSTLGAVTWAPGGAAWAAGQYLSGTRYHPLIMRWNGKAWIRVTVPTGSEALSGLAFSAGNYGWAVGSTSTTTGSSATVILHWNGKAWSPAG